MAKKDRVPILTKMRGRPGETLITSFTKEEQRVDDLKIEDYRRMLNDGQVQMLWNAITTTILAAGVKIEDDTENEELSEEQKFIEQNLLTPKWKGGMDTPMDSINRVMLRAFIEGYRLFEVIYRQEGDKIYLEKLSPRSGKTDSEIKIVVTNNGDFAGFHQMISWMGRRIDVKVLNGKTALKVVKPTYGAEFGSLYGRSGFKGAWYHYDKAHQGMFLNHVGHELGAIKYRYGKTKGMSEDKTNDAITKLAKAHVESVFLAPQDELEVTFESLSDAGVMAVGKDMIDLHYSMIAKSILAQFIDLGSNISNTGSRSLGDTQMEFFKQGLQSIATVLIEEPWNQIIAALIKLNFGGDIYPTLKVNNISDDSADLLHEALIELVKKGNVTDSVKVEILSEGAKSMGLDVNKDHITEEMVEDKNEQREQQQQQLEKAEFSDIEEPMRALFPDEQKVKLLAIARKLENGKTQSERILRNQIESQKIDIIDGYLAQLTGGKKVKLELSDYDTSYSEELLLIAMEMMEFGKISVANELGVKVPNTRKTDRKRLSDEVELIVDEQTARLHLRLQSIINDSKHLPENTVRGLLEQEYNSFFDKVITPTVVLLVPKAMNWGRRVTFEANEKIIWAYRFTAVLDSQTTITCRKLDGKILQTTDPDYYMLEPPLHFNAVLEGTKILTKEGEIEVESIQKGDLVMTHEGNYQRVYDTMRKLEYKEYYEIELENGKTINITGEHPVLTDRGWIAVDDLKLTDNIICVEDINDKG